MAQLDDAIWLLNGARHQRDVDADAALKIANELLNALVMKGTLTEKEAHEIVEIAEAASREFVEFGGACQTERSVLSSLAFVLRRDS